MPQSRGRGVRAEPVQAITGQVLLEKRVPGCALLFPRSERIMPAGSGKGAARRGQKQKGARWDGEATQPKPERTEKQQTDWSDDPI